MVHLRRGILFNWCATKLRVLNATEVSKLFDENSSEN